MENGTKNDKRESSRIINKEVCIMKRLYGSIIALAMVLVVAGSAGVAFSDEKAEWNEFSNDAGVEYVLECCDIFKATIGESDTFHKATMQPEELYGP